MEENRDLYIKILKYCDKRRDGFTLREIKRDLSLSNSQFGFLQRERVGADVFTDMGEHRDIGKGSEQVLMLSFEGKFKLLEYIELQEARRASRIATWFATAALLISILVAAYQIFVPAKVIVIEDQTASKNLIEQAPVEP